MPSTSVAQRKSARRKITEKYSGFRKDSSKKAARLAKMIASERARTQRKGMSNKGKK